MPTATTTRRGHRRAMTPITVTGRYTSFATRRPEVFTAVSTDGVWAYQNMVEDEDGGTHWYATHVPTGEVQTFTKLAAARAWTATPDAVKLLTAAAFDVLISDHTSTAEQDRARQTLITLGALLPRTTEAEAVCRHCGGHLAAVNGVWVHIAGRRRWDGTAWTDVAVCRLTGAVMCDHSSCHKPAGVHVWPCLLGHEGCCGCCQGESA